MFSQSLTYQNLALLRLNSFGTASNFNQNKQDSQTTYKRNQDELKIFSNTLSYSYNDISDMNTTSFFDSKYEQFKTLDGNSKLFFLCFAGILFMMNAMTRHYLANKIHQKTI